MRLYLNAGFGELLGSEVLQAIRDRGYAGVRQDIPNRAAAQPLCEELARAQVQPILLVGGGKMGHDDHGTSPEDLASLATDVAKVANDLGLFDTEAPAAIEIGNEPDIAFTYSRRPDLFSELVQLSRDRIRHVSGTAQIISGGVASTDQRGLDYLNAALEHALPDDCIIGYHTYRTTQPPETPHSGFSSRDAEFARLKVLAAGRPIWCTESGWHTAPSEVRSGPFGLRRKRIQYTDEQVADFAEREVRLNARHGAIGLAWFQLNDGPNANYYEHRFGIKALDGTWKPVAERLASLGPDVVVEA